ncbi:hypothetical protein, partial [Chromobacterium subtsugae]|uniref:hypothetical protein n=1 Tax=Chromobacterium subtsugae TaxID=251747 RepID=UPI001C0F7DA8
RSDTYLHVEIFPCGISETKCNLSVILLQQSKHSLQKSDRSVTNCLHKAISTSNLRALADSLSDGYYMKIVW